MLRQALKRYIDQKYPSWDITIALRYLPIMDDIKKSYKNTKTILEVGSEINGITTYFPKAVTGVDINFDYSKRNKYLTPIKASALKLPFPDNSMDYVLSVDMLEHIPRINRLKAVSEMVRVSKFKVYLSFPTGKKSEDADKELYEYFLKKRGEEYQYLKEHVELGLPDIGEVRKFLNSVKNSKLKVLKNTNLRVWKTLLKLGLSGDKFKSSLYRRLLILLPILKHLNFGPTYRVLFILEKKV